MLTGARGGNTSQGHHGLKELRQAKATLAVPPVGRLFSLARLLSGTAWAFQPLLSGARMPQSPPRGSRDREGARWPRNPSYVLPCETLRPKRPRAARQGDTYSSRRQHPRPGSRRGTAGEGQGGKTRARSASLPARRARSASTEPSTSTPVYLHRGRALGVARPGAGLARSCK